MPSTSPDARSVSLVTLGCSRNDVDSEELAGRLSGAGWQLSDENPDVVVVNTCGFIEQAKQDSVNTLLEAADTGATVIAAGCMAERYGAELAESLPEAAAVLSFDDYAEIDQRLTDALQGQKHTAHTPRDRRSLLPLTPVERQSAPATELTPGHAPASGPRVMRRRLENSPVAPLKIASGCDRRCTFCAIPKFRGSFLSRPPAEILAEAEWLAQQGVREVFLVSENTTSYGKDLGDPALINTVLRDLTSVDGIERVRASYLQPAEIRSEMLRTLLRTDGVAAYCDISFQHASNALLRRMRRFGSPESFLSLLEQVRALNPDTGIRSNFIVGFPGETDEEFSELVEFVTAARLDYIGVFQYSDEDGTEAESLENKVPQEVIEERYAHLSVLAEELTAQRAAERIGSTVRVLVESVEDSAVEGRTEFQAPESDGITVLEGVDAQVGEFVTATVTDSRGCDLIAVP